MDVRLYTYIVARDFGFAPNPFFGCCTLCTCKPQIRARASVGDWVVGTGSKTQQHDGRLIFAMEVTEALSFAQYWDDPRFRRKRPVMSKSYKYAFGDNIYYQDERTGEWLMLDSHHSFHDGTPNPDNVEHDTQAPRVLVSTNFTYWGGAGPEVPAKFRDFDGEDVVCTTRGYRNDFSPHLVEQFVAWLQTHEHGYVGEPLEWMRGRALRTGSRSA